MADAPQKSALVLIDLQNDYFPGGRFELFGAPAAVAKARLVLDYARRTCLPVLHVRHEADRPGATFFLPGTPGAAIHPDVAPLPGETVVCKHFPNSFRETALQTRLTALGVTHLVVAGMLQAPRTGHKEKDNAILLAVTQPGTVCVASLRNS